MKKLKERDTQGVLLAKNKKGKVSEFIHKSKYADDLHQAYRGGYIRTWKTGVISNVTSIDFNSLYPHCACIMDLPLLATERKVKEPLRIYNLKTLLEKQGISRALVYNDTCSLGLLQIRVPEKSYIPSTGKYLLGTWTNLELKKALEEGYKIIEIEWSILWDTAEKNILKEVFSETYKKRVESNNEFDKEFYKDMMNRGIGKFAQRKNGYEIIVDSIERIEEYENELWKMIKGIPNSINVIYAKDAEWTPKKYYNPTIPMFINAYGRTIMYDNYKKIPYNKLVYSDTDNIIWEGDSWLKGEFNIGENMGQFKVEKDVVTKEPLENVRAIIWGTKTKAIGNNIAIAGIHKAGILLNDFEKGEVSDKKMVGIMKGGETDTGRFIQEVRDLRKQNKEFKKSEEKLAKQILYIDDKIGDIEFFRKEIEMITTKFK